MKYYFISDIHGYFDEMQKCLKQAGYNENDANSKLIVVGDIFDRGTQAVETYKYLKRLTDEGKVIVLYGNHHKFLIDFLEGTNESPFNYNYNGLDETLADFWHRTMPFESYCLFDADCDIDTSENFKKFAKVCRNDINKEFPDLLPWLKSMPRYFETDNIIATHGALDFDVPDWHFPEKERYNLKGWDALDFDDGSFILRKNKTGKKVIVGHFGTGQLRGMHGIGSNQDFSILKTKDNKYFIDGCVPHTNKINVLVLEDENNSRQD